MITRHGWWLGIVSKGRPERVQKAQHLLGFTCTWYVWPGEADAYRAAGATTVVEVPPPPGSPVNTVASRNRLLDDAFAHGVPAVMSDDDLKYLRLHPGRQHLTFADAVGHMLAGLQATGAHLAGANVTTHTLGFNPERPIHTTGFIRACLNVTLPTDLRYDPAYVVKEDYDYTCQHLERYGKVARVDAVMAEYAYRSASGGYADTRSSAHEKAAIARLMERWPRAFVPHPKRADEVVLRWRPSAGG